MVSLQAIRLAQLRQLSDEEVANNIRNIRASRAIAKLTYHFKEHGWLLGAQSEEDYLRMLLGHLRRDDLRIFTFIRARDQAIFWALVAPDTGDTVLYHEARGRIWSFYRPEDPAIRMANVRTRWVEVIKSEQEWRFEEYWEWET